MTKKISNTAVKFAAVVQILALTLLAACSAVGVNASANVCHATGDAANPYEEIAIDSTELLNEHRVHAEDIFPVPAGGCPARLVEVVEGNITICHAASSETNPYEEITVSVNGLNGHGKHEGDIIPVPEDGCPASPEATEAVSSDGKITICHATSSKKNPYNEITVSVNGLNGHDKHDGDIIPAPAGGCPSTKP